MEGRGHEPDRSGSTEPRLLEREGELATLGSLIDSARAGEGGVAVVEGPPGIGKTGLLATIVTLAQTAGLLVLTAVGIELETDFAFGIVRQLFEPVVTQLEPEERAAALAGVAGVSAPLVDPRHERATAAMPGDAFPVLHGLYWLSANLSATKPLLIATDDAHWSDGQSLRWLHYLAGRLDGLPILVVVASRSTSPEAPVPLIEAIKDRPGVRMIRPAPLSPVASADLLERIFDATPQEGFVRTAHEVTGGNPFFLEALGRSLAEDGIPPEDGRSDQLIQVRPEAVSRSMLVRLAALPASSRAAARAIAVLGDATEPQHVARLADVRQEDVPQAGALLADAGLLAANRPLRFAHPIIRSTLYGDLSPAERDRMHRLAARILADESAPARQVGAHLLAVDSNADPWVVDALRAAAGEAMARGAPDAAVGYLRRAFAEPPESEARAAVLGELGMAEASLADAQAEVHLRAAVEAADSVPERASLARMLGFLFLQLARPREGAEVLDRAISEVGDAERELRLLLEADLLLALTIDLDGGFQRGQRLVHSRAGHLEGETPGERALLATLAEWRGRSTEATADQTVADAARAVAGGRLLEEGGPGSPHLAWALYALIYSDAFDPAEGQVQPALRRARESGSLFVAGQVAAVAALLALRRGSLSDAEAHGRDSLEFAMRIREADAGRASSDDESRTPPPAGIFFTLSVFIDTLIERGELEAARAELEQVGMLGPMPPVATSSFLLESRARLQLALGEADSALADALEAGRVGEAWGVRSPGYSAWRSVAGLAKARLGDDAGAVRLATEEIELAERFGARRAIGVALRARGLVVGGPDGLADLRGAVDALAPSGARLEHARALAELGAALRRANHRSASREPLRLAVDMARGCGALALAERAHQELRATGARPRRLELSGVESLTARERQIAGLAAEGRSNPEIAQSLFVTRRTVETHLTSAYRKLDISSRDDLAKALEE